MQPMYAGQPNSPQTELATAIDEVQTTIEVLNGNVLPDAPNLAVIGEGDIAETIRYESKSGNILSGVTRGFQGEARSWSQGQKVMRSFTAYDYDTLVYNLESLDIESREKMDLINTDIQALSEEIGELDQEISEVNAEVIQGRISEPKNETFENIKARLDSGEEDLISYRGEVNTKMGYRPKQTLLLNELFRKLRLGEEATIVCLGDSLTYGYDTTSPDRRPPDSNQTSNGSTHNRERASSTYPEALQNYLNQVYSDNITVINRGYSGDTTASSYPRWNDNPNSDVTLIMLGTNDSSQNVGLENFLKWYRRIIEREIGWGSAVILLTPPRRRTVNISDDVYGNSVFSLGDEYGCPVIDMTELTANMSASNFSDQTHYNGKGYDYLGARLTAIFIGEGIVNPLKVSGGRSLLVRENVDGVKFVNGVTGLNNTGYPTADDEITGSGRAAFFNSGGTGRLIYSFYTETDDLLVYPSIYFGPAAIEPAKLILDFGTESQAVSNTYLFDQTNGAYNKHVETTVDLVRADCNWRTQRDVFYINGVKSMNEKKIHIPKRGWHTLMFECEVVTLHGIDFVGYREMRAIASYNAQVNL